MNIKEFKSFNKKALVLATVSVATLASCSKDEISQDISNNNPQTEISQQGKGTGDYIVMMQDGSEFSSAQTAPSGNKMVEELSQKMLSENGIKGIELTAENTFSGIANGFTAKLNAEQLASLKNDSRVAYIEEDKIV